MDAVEFFKWLKRLCDTYAKKLRDCKKCPVYIGKKKAGFDACITYIWKAPEEVVEIVKKWSEDRKNGRT